MSQTSGFHITENCIKLFATYVQKDAEKVKWVQDI